MSRRGVYAACRPYRKGFKDKRWAEELRVVEVLAGRTEKKARQPNGHRWWGAAELAGFRHGYLNGSLE